MDPSKTQVFFVPKGQSGLTLVTMTTPWLRSALGLGTTTCTRSPLPAGVSFQRACNVCVHNKLLSFQSEFRLRGLWVWGVVAVSQWGEEGGTYVCMLTRSIACGYDRRNLWIPSVWCLVNAAHHSNSLHNITTSIGLHSPQSVSCLWCRLDLSYIPRVHPSLVHNTTPKPKDGFLLGVVKVHTPHHQSHKERIFSFSHSQLSPNQAFLRFDQAFLRFVAVSPPPPPSSLCPPSSSSLVSSSLWLLLLPLDHVGPWCWPERMPFLEHLALCIFT